VKEVYESEFNLNEYNSINYKLKKLVENLIKIKNNNELDKDSHYINSIIEYISDALSIFINFNN
jgi:hypothetical protein